MFPFPSPTGHGDGYLQHGNHTPDCYQLRPGKRQRKIDQMILEAAATLLNTSVDRLLATAKASSSSQSSPQQPIQPYAPSGNGHPNDKLPENNLNMVESLFSLALPDSGPHLNPPPDSVPETSEYAGTPRSFDSLSFQGESNQHPEDFPVVLNPNTSTSSFGLDNDFTTSAGQPTGSYALTTTAMDESVNSTTNSYQQVPWSGVFYCPESPFSGNSNALMDVQADRILQESEVGRMGQDETVSSRQGTKRKRGPFRDSEQRIETGLTRKLGACISCSMQRIRCVPDPQNPSGCCRTCIQAARTRLYWLPCLRYKIPDAELLDHAACPRPSWSRRWKKMEIMDIPAQHWASKEIKTIQITQDVGGTCYKLKVRQFKPTDGDSLERRWKTNGKPQYFKCTPYAIANMKEAGKVLSEFADRTVGTAISHYIDETDVLLRSTYTMAYRYSRMAERDQERDLLRAVLRLWCASRMESHSDRICGDETLGMTPQDYGRDCPNTGMILTPPVFSAQLEVIVVATILQPAKKEVLQRLKDLMQENHGRQSWQQPCWFTIYLAMFVLLHSCAMLTAGDNKKARKQGSEARFFRHSVVESLHNGAKILLAYFHYCNKGSRPFSMDWSSPDQMARAGLDTEQAEFMRLTANEVQKRTVNFRQIREQGIYEHDYYFISQLYDSDWKPKHTI